MSGASAIVWKEWREQFGQRGLRGKQGVVLFVATFGIVLPLMNGPSWITSPLSAVAWSWVPMFLVTTVIADAFAGERERHTLETLLASRLPDHAILFGKIGAAIGYAAALTAASLILGLITINATSASAGLVFYSRSAVAAMIVVGFLGSLFAATVGVLISLRSATVKQAQQTLGGVIMVLLLLPMLAARWMPSAWKTGLVSSGLSVTQLAMIGALLLLLLDAGVVSLALVRFKRARLIAVVIALVLCPSPSTAQTAVEKSSSTSDSLLSCASRMATRAGFQAVPGARPGRLGLMRARTVDGKSLVDGLRVSVALPDAPHSTPLDVSVTTFEVTGLSNKAVPPPKSLTALADSIRLGCRRRS